MKNSQFKTKIQHLITNPTPRQTNTLIAIVAAVAVGTTGYILLRTSAASADASVVTSTKAAAKVGFEIGFDHTQTSHLASDAGGDPAAVKSAKTLLTALNAPQNVHIMGFGAGNPSPSKGKYSWASLDSRIRVMGDTVPEAQRMITLCTAPGWMKGTDDWNMEAAVQPAHFADFAALSAEVAKRYDGQHNDSAGKKLPKVSYFDVWNEMKGFWNNKANRWDYEGYTKMYNAVYTAIKQVRPDAKIGGPYPSFGPSPYNPSNVKGAYGIIDQRSLDVITYWLRNKKGADFISMDGGPQTDHKTGALKTDGFSAGQMFADLATWVRKLDNTKYPGARTLPIIWAEFYPGKSSATGQKAVAITIDNAIKAGLAGVNDIYIWEPEGNAQGNSPYTGKAVWTDTAKSGGGKATSFYAALKTMRNNFPVGTQLYSASVKGNITALAGKDKVLLVSRSASTLRVSVNGALVSLSPYAIVIVPLSPQMTP